MRLTEIQVPKVGAVPNVWIAITKSWRPATLLSLKAAVEKASVDPNDTEAVRGVWDRLIADNQARYDALRQEASKDRVDYETRAAQRNAEIEQIGALPIKKVMK